MLTEISQALEFTLLERIRVLNPSRIHTSPKQHPHKTTTMESYFKAMIAMD